MPAVRNPSRSPLFRIITIAASGMGSFVLGTWGLRLALGDEIGGMSSETVGAIIAALCALAASIAAASFFAGVDESADYVFNETHFDKLTGLLARTAMVGKIAEAASATARTGKPVFLIDIDIDRFKQINDAIGYSNGDALIRAFTARLKAALPSDVVLGRIGAGEFAILYPDQMLSSSLEALVDRLIHRAEIIEIEADSYRLKEAKELNAARSKQRRTKKS